MLVALLFSASLALASTSPIAWPSLSGPATPSGLGAEDAAVVAGVGDYFKLPPISGAADNATDWYQWLTAVRGVPVRNVRLMRDGDVTREELIAAVDQARTQVGANGTLWIVFIGHGAPAKSGDDGLLLGVDAQRSEVSINARGVPQKLLLESAAKGAQRETVAIFDACFSGMSSDGKTPLVPGSQATLPVRRVEPATNGVVVLSSSEEIAGPLPGSARPAFSYLLLGALRGWGDRNNDATITLDEAFGYTHSTLVTVVRDKNQTPTMRGASTTNMIVAKNATEKGPDLARFIAQREPPVVKQVVPVETRETRPRVDLDQAQQRAAEERFKQRELRVQEATGSNEEGWTRPSIVRGPYKRAVSTDELLDAGRERAPDAAAVVDELTWREGVETWGVFAPAIGGAVVGAAGGAAVALLAPPELIGNTDDAFKWVMFPTMGGAVTSMAAMLVIGLPLGIGAALTEEDHAQLHRAKVDLAKAANEAEREKLGLSTAARAPDDVNGNGALAGRWRSRYAGTYQIAGLAEASNVVESPAIVATTPGGGMTITFADDVGRPDACSASFDANHDGTFRLATPTTCPTKNPDGSHQMTTTSSAHASVRGAYLIIEGRGSFEGTAVNGARFTGTFTGIWTLER